jgi:hypothetical protein
MKGTTMKTTAEATYLGQLDGWHRWTDGTALPVLFGFDGSDDDEEGVDEDDEQEQDEEQDDEGEEPPKTKKTLRPERQAAQYRTQRNTARKERDELRTEVYDLKEKLKEADEKGTGDERDALRIELAFARAAGGQFVDADAAWKLADRALMSVGDDGSVAGAEEAVEALAEANPFLLAPAPDDRPDRNPFNEARSSGRVMNGRKKTASETSTYNIAELRKRYPALRLGR